MIDVPAQRVWSHGREIARTSREYALLESIGATAANVVEEEIGELHERRRRCVRRQLPRLTPCLSRFSWRVARTAAAR
jgi:hypothetical protein